MKALIDELAANRTLADKEMECLILQGGEYDAYLYQKAQQVRKQYYGNAVYIRGLVEISNHCRNNCYYCGIRALNRQVARYRLSKDDILDCCEHGYTLGFRTFVLQGGEDMYYTDAMMIDIISSIRKRYPDCAITLSIGERSYDTYKAYYEAGANRYLLRHETANGEHYARLHPQELSSQRRRQCLYDLKAIGYQVGTGFMVGSPYQTAAMIVEDLKFIAALQPQMVGIGPFIPHHQTPFALEKQGSEVLTLRLLAIIRLMLPAVLLPATTALSTIDDRGREKGILAGANVIMPNLSPAQVREKYMIYDNKAFTGVESAEGLQELNARLQQIGYETVISRGDALSLHD